MLMIGFINGLLGAVAGSHDNHGLICFELVSIGVIGIALSLPLIAGKVEMNKSYGIRIAKAYKSLENWYALNKYGGKVMTGWSVVLLLLAPLAVMFKENRAVQTWLVYGPALYVFAMAQIYWFARKLP